MVNSPVGDKRDDREAHVAEGRETGKPRVDASRRQAEHRAHGRAHGLAVERVAAGGIEQDGVGAERGRAPEDSTDVVWIPHRFEEDQPPRLREGRQRQRLGWAANEREAAAMKLEAGDALNDRGFGHEHEPRGIDARLERAKGGRRHEDRVDDEPAGMFEIEALDDEAAFSDEQAVLLEPRRLADVAIVLKPRIVLSTEVADQSSSR